MHNTTLRPSVTERILDIQQCVVEMIAQAKPLHEVLTSINRLVEAQDTGILCSVLLLMPDGKHLRCAAAESFPKEYNDSIDGMEIGPSAGSCGTAAFTREMVVVRDIATDPKWAPFATLALRFGLQACWSMPIMNGSGAVLGTFAIYVGEPRDPEPFHLDMLHSAAHLASIAIERSREQERYDEQQAQLVQAQKMEVLGRLASGVAHDFNNLLTAIMGYTEIADLSLSPNDPARASLATVYQAAERAGELTRQLLAFARKQTVEPQVVDIGGLISGVERLLRRVIGEDVELATSAEPGLWLARMDPGQFEQVLVNLAVNARDAMPEGGTLTVQASNAVVGAGEPAPTPGEYVVLSVRDTGLGMTDEVRQHLFEPFFTTKPLGKGTGLGLATCYGIVTQAGGFIEVQSAPGRGASFRVFLPRVADTESAPDDAPHHMPVSIRHETILLVEDEPLVRFIAAEALQRAGYRVLQTANGEEALAVLAQGKTVDLLLTDMVMPRMGGRELVGRVREQGLTLPVLYLSGYTDDIIASEEAAAFHAIFLQKPFTAATLTAKVRQVLEAAARERAD